MTGKLGFVSQSATDRRVIDDVDALTHALPRKPRVGLLDGLKQAGITSTLIGDARKPRELLSAVAEGRAAVRSLNVGTKV